MKLSNFRPSANAMTLKTSASLKLDLKSRMRPDPLAIVIKHDRNRTEGESNETQQTISPAQTQRGVHLQAEKRETRSQDRSEDRVGGDGGSCIARVGVDEVGVDAEESADHADANQEGTEKGHSPLDVVLGCPAIQEEACGEERRGVHEHGKAVFGFEDAAVVFVGETADDGVGEAADDEEAYEHADAETDVHEADDGLGEAVVFFKDEGEGCEEEVEYAVNDGHKE